MFLRHCLCIFEIYLDLTCLLNGVWSFWIKGMGIDGPGFGGMNRMGGGYVQSNSLSYVFF